MTEKRDRDFARGLAQFERLWARVSAAKEPRTAAADCGVKLMPRRDCRRRRGGKRTVNREQ